LRHTEKRRDYEKKEERDRTDITEEPGDEIAENDGFVCFVVIRGGRDACQIPEVALPFVKARIGTAGVEEEDAGVALDEPATKENLDALGAHGLYGGTEMVVCGLLCLDLHGGSLVGEGTDETVSVAELLDGDGDLCLYDGVYAADLVCDLPSAFEEDGIADVALFLRGRHRLNVGGSQVFFISKSGLF